MENNKNDLRKFAPFLLTSSKNIAVRNLESIYSDNELLDFYPFEVSPDSKNQYDSKDNGGAEYLVIPSWKNPRFFVYNDKKLIQNIGNLIKPTSFKAKLAWKIALFLNRFNAIKLLFRNSIFIKTDNLGDLFLNENDQNKSKYVVYTGAIGIYQKWTVQEMNETNEIVSFAKIGRSKLSKERILKEKNCLRFLSDVKFETFEIPKLIDFYQKNEFCVIKQDACNTDYSHVISDFSSLHQKVLEELHLKLKKEVNTKKFIYSLHNEIEKITIDDIFVQSTVTLIKTNLSKIESQLIKKEVLTFTFSHGDFTQWNSFSNGSKLFVFDWEMGDYRMPLWDYFNFIYHSTFLVNNHNEKFLQKVISQNQNWAKSLVGDTYSICHKIYLIEITIHYLQQYQELEQIGIENSVYELISQFPKFLNHNF
jgi:hypothetical protein|tara:strand:+ start:417 stop:1682 length:1266 start_codon:yes stop_codon:yes gene_type:complete